MRRIIAIVSLVSFGIGYYYGAKNAIDYSKGVLQQMQFDIAFNDMIHKDAQSSAE